MTTGLQAGQAKAAKALTLGEVIRAALPDFAAGHRLPEHHWKVLRAIAACHTPALGGHQYQCTNCGTEHFVPHSCGNRHCPTCRQLSGAHWLEQQAQSLLPIPYFHVVFTLPHELNPLLRHNQAQLYSLLFASATDTLLQFGRHNLKATLGVTAVLHTWGQNLCDHYHLHCVVTGGGLALDAQSWVSLKPNWLFPVRALSIVFRAKFRDGLQQLFAQGQLQCPAGLPPQPTPNPSAWWLRRCAQRDWVVYAKTPFAGPQAVLGYLCRYTQRVAISNRRLETLELEQHTVSFRYKDYAQGAPFRSLCLPLQEFLRRFCLHILPPRFVKIRHYGLLANRDRPARIAQLRALLAPPTGPAEQLPPTLPLPKHLVPPPLVCPACGQPTLVLIRIIPRPSRTAPPPLDSS